MLGMGEIDRFLEQWEMDVPSVHRRLILAPTPRERERWHAVWLLAQGWSASDTAGALSRDPHTIGRWLAAFDQGGPAALMFEQTGGSPPDRGMYKRDYSYEPSPPHLDSHLPRNDRMGLIVSIWGRFCI